MWKLYAISLALLSGCYDQIEMTADSTAECFYGDIRVFQGKVSFEGTSLGGFQEKLKGQWTVLNVTEDIRCYLESKDATMDVGQQ